MVKQEVVAHIELENLLVKLENAGYQCSLHTDLSKKLIVFNVAAKKSDLIHLAKRMGLTKHFIENGGVK